jgi:hypothetical protein
MWSNGEQIARAPSASVVPERHKNGECERRLSGLAPRRCGASRRGEISAREEGGLLAVELDSACDTSGLPAVKCIHSCVRARTSGLLLAVDAERHAHVLARRPPLASADRTTVTAHARLNRIETALPCAV